MNSLFKKSIVAGVLTLTALGSIPTAYAQSSSNADLQAKIAELMATITALQAKLNNGSTAGTINYQWTRSLTLGSTGEDVRMLQRFLNTDPDTRVAQSGAGSTGSETTYFGPATAAAVAKFQNKYRSDILTPNGLIAATGYFGPASINKANALAKINTPAPGSPSPSKPDTDNKPPQLRGEGALETFKIDAASDTDIEEAAADAPIAELTLEARDGDIRISRLDLSLVADNGNTEKDPWDTFEEISIWVDDEKIAEKRIDRKTDYLNRNLGSLRFSNLDLVLEEDEEVEVIVAVSTQNSVDGAGTAATWSVSVDRMRYFDADNVSNDEGSTGDLGTSVSFDIVQRGDGEELKFALGANNPAASTIVVDESKKTTGETILEYTIEAIDGDIELDKLYLNIETGTAPYTSVVDSVRLVINGKSFKQKSVTTTGSYSATNTLVMFDIDGDVTIDEDDKETVKVVVDFKSQTGYQNGETIVARITSAERDLTEAEGADDVTSFTGTVVGKQHNLISNGITVPAGDVSLSTAVSGENDTVGTFTIEFEVTAIEGDFYIKSTAATSAATTTGGVKFFVDSTAGTPSSVSAALSSSADEDTDGVFTVREGRSEEFTLYVVIDAAAAGQHRVGIESLFFSSTDDGLTNARTYNVTPLTDYRTAYRFINN